MVTNQSAFGRKARSVCMVTDSPVRLEAKNKKASRRKAGAQIVRFGETVVLVSLTATGEVIIEIDPP